MKRSHFLLLGVMVMLAATMQSQNVYGECPPNSAPVSEKDNVVHCRCIQGFENKGGVCLPVTKPETKNDKLRKAWQKALSCAMEQVYARAESLGGTGKNFSQELRNEMTRVFNEAGKPVKNSNEDQVVTLDLDRQESLSVSADRQFIVNVAVHSLYDDNIHVDVQSYFSSSGNNVKDRQEYLENLIQINKFGEIMADKESAAVKACLAK
ncbi:MAG: hypothetical protein ABSD50_11155 [Smithella sp.]